MRVYQAREHLIHLTPPLHNHLLSHFNIHLIAHTLCNGHCSYSSRLSASNLTVLGEHGQKKLRDLSRFPYSVQQNAIHSGLEVHI